MRAAPLIARSRVTYAVSTGGAVLHSVATTPGAARGGAARGAGSPGGAGGARLVLAVAAPR